MLLQGEGAAFEDVHSQGVTLSQVIFSLRGSRAFCPGGVSPNGIVDRRGLRGLTQYTQESPHI